MTNLTMDFVKLDFFETFQLYNIMTEAACSHGSEYEALKGDELVANLESLQRLPMTKGEAIAMLPHAKAHYDELNLAFEDDWDNIEFTSRKRTACKIIDELERISKL